MHIFDMLREGGVEPCFSDGETGESRTNYLLVEEETRDATLVADKGPLPGDDQVRAFYDLMRATVGEGDLLALSGDASNFPDPYIYHRIIDLLADKGVKVFLDASGPSLVACIQMCIRDRCCGAGVGGNLVNKQWIAAGEWDRITALAKEFVEAVCERG